VPARPPLPDGPFLVVGLARSGVAAARSLRAAGAEVRGADSGVVADEVRDALEATGVEVHAASTGVEQLAGIRTVVKSPGVPQEAPVVAAARDRGLLVVGELEIAWRLLPNEFIAVTGSNGKTTTVELIGHIHREAGLPVVVAGNVGTALASLVGTLDPAATVVAEASSFQLEDTELFAPEAAVLLNVAPDHLDRHGTLEAYRQAKLQVFARQANEAVAVAPLGLGVEDLGGCARRVCFGAGPGAELADRNGWLWWDEEPLIAVDGIRLRGLHNRQNAMAAAAVCLARGVDPAAVCAGLETFAGVPHRLEEVAVRDGVTYVNDSKATNVDAAIVGIGSFDGGVHVILGGRGKGQDFTPLAGPVAERCRAAYLIGEAAGDIASALDGRVPVHESGDLETAVAAAREAAGPGDVVLLSPACASYDQFTDFEARGDRFRELVTAV
jgi:UDP-N-acetylmuramoylalanine--D-glutamate ligase